MRQLNPYFLIGTLGMLFTAMLHILVAAILSEAATASYTVLYPIFIGFLILGTIVMIRKKEAIKTS